MMKKFKGIIKRAIIKHGAVIASCAFAFVVLSANSSCLFPFYEPDEPKNMKDYKKFNR